MDPRAGSAAGLSLVNWFPAADWAWRSVRSMSCSPSLFGMSRVLLELLPWASIAADLVPMPKRQYEGKVFILAAYVHRHPDSVSREKQVSQFFILTDWAERVEYCAGNPVQIPYQFIVSSPVHINTDVRIRTRLSSSKPEMPRRNGAQGTLSVRQETPGPWELFCKPHG